MATTGSSGKTVPAAPDRHTIPDTSVESKSIIITGGASGIGLAIARHFASQNQGSHRIALLDIDAFSGQEVADGISAEYSRSGPSRSSKVSFIKCDVSSWEDQARAFKKVFELHGGRIDIVFANAGISEQGRTTVVDLTEEDDEPKPPRLRVLDVNLLGCIYCKFPALA